MSDFIQSSKKSNPIKKVINEALYILNCLGIPFEGMICTEYGKGLTKFGQT
ncbi:MAG: hypothetical protein WAX69_15610 [Victivallales bacterium]